MHLSCFIEIGLVFDFEVSFILYERWDLFLELFHEGVDLAGTVQGVYVI